MPRTSDLRLTTSEKNALSSRGYVLSTKLGEGAYSKVCCPLFRILEFSISINQLAKVYLSVYSRSSETLKLACKVIDIRKATKTYANKFLPRELDCLMKVKHPHIVHVHSIFRRDFKYYIFMRYERSVYTLTSTYL